MANSFAGLLSVAEVYVDCCRRFLTVAARWNSGPTQVPIDGVDWTAIEAFETLEINAALTAVESAVSQLEKVCGNLPKELPDAWKPVFTSAAALGRYAMNDARTRGWFAGNHALIAQTKPIHALDKSVTLLSFLAEVITVRSLSRTARDILECLFESGMTLGNDLARKAINSSKQDSSFREMLSAMSKAGLIKSGRGRHSQGYHLSERGMQLAQLSRQLKDF